MEGWIRIQQRNLILIIEMKKRSYSQKHMTSKKEIPQIMILLLTSK